MLAPEKANLDDVKIPGTPLNVLYTNIGYWQMGVLQMIYRKDKYTPLRSIFKKRPEELGYFDDLIQQTYDTLMPIFASMDLLGLLIEAMNDYLKENLNLEWNYPLTTAEDFKRLEKLREDGNTFLDPVPSYKIDEMRAYFESMPVMDAEGNSFIRNPKDMNVGSFSLETVARCPHLFEIANDPKILSVVKEYLGLPPTIMVATAFKSYAGQEAAKDAQLFHLDYDDYKFVKLFIYLTDVDEESGPHVYINGTHDLRAMAVIRNHWSGGFEEFDKWWVGTLRKTDEQVQKFLGLSPTKICGKAGSAFLVDTRGIHKGLLPKNRNRIVCQITYGLSPRMQQTPQLLPASHPIVTESMKQPVNRYINRLFIDYQN